jgi:hypothetical protein
MKRDAIHARSSLSWIAPVVYPGENELFDLAEQAVLKHPRAPLRIGLDFEQQLRILLALGAQ